MAIATGVNKQLIIKKESAFGTFAGPTGGQLLRRVTSGINMTKGTVRSNEIASHLQVASSRHGVRKVEGPISGELSGGTYQMLFEAALRAGATAVSNITAVELTVAASGSLYTVTRAAGSWITDGVRIGSVVRATVGLNANSLNKNLLVVNLTALIATVLVLNGTTLTAEAGVAGCTVTFPGKKLSVPSSAHTDDSFSVEEWHDDVDVSRLALGCKVNTIGVKLPASGAATVDFGFMGQDMTFAATQQFTSPTSPTTSDIYTAAVGALCVGTTPVGLITGMNFDINGGMSTVDVAFANKTPDVFEGRVTVSGQMSILLQDTTFLDAFDDETEMYLSFALATSNLGAADFMAFHFPRVKINGATPDDGEKGIIQTVPFDALLKSAATGFEATTVLMQDSLYT